MDNKKHRLKIKGVDISKFKCMVVEFKEDLEAANKMV